MATAVVDQGIRDFYGENLTVPINTGDPTAFAIRIGFKELLVRPAAKARLQFAPAIRQLWFYDASQPAASRWVNLLGGNRSLINRHASGGTGTNLDSMTSSDFIYIGTSDRAGGYRMEISGSPNANASVMALSYSRSDDTWASQAITDGTILTGFTLGQTGIVKLNAVPTDWEPESLQTLIPTIEAGAPTDTLHWVRLSVSATLDADTEVDKMIPHHQDGLGAGNNQKGLYIQATTEYTIDIHDRVGAVELVSDGAATNADVTWIRR